MERTARQLRPVKIDFVTRDDSADSKDPVIEGYFAVFDSTYEIAPGMSESIAPGAFQNSLSGDVRMLVNHDTSLVVGRTAAHTMELREDSRGLWACASVNPKDTDAMNAYARIERGDVSQASIGFEIIKEDTEFRDDGSIHWTIREALLHEVSICTFPAYRETNISARSAERDELIKRRHDVWAAKLKERLKDGIKSTDAQKED